MIIESRFNGPPDSANGGYVAGLIAAELAPTPAGHAAQVTLRLPPPLNEPLQVTPTTGGVEVRFGDRLVAEATQVPFEDPPVPPIDYHQAVAAAAAYPGFANHPYPTCYVCGPQRDPDDGLRIFPGPLPDGRTAAPWQVPANTTLVTMWAALDCPGGWTILAPGRPYLLGRLTARVLAVPAAGSHCVVVGAVESVAGRKAQVRTAVYEERPAGRLLGQAHATWIAV